MGRGHRRKESLMQLRMEGPRHLRIKGLSSCTCKATGKRLVQQTCEVASICPRQPPSH